MATCLRRLCMSYTKIKHLKLMSVVCSISTRQIKQRSYSTSKNHEEFDSEEEGYDELYPGHIPTTFFQKSLLTVGSAVMSLYNPARDDMIATLGETSGYWALKNMKRKMEEDPVGLQILQERPVINTGTVSVGYLESFPEGTFGKEYWKFLNSHVSYLLNIKGADFIIDYLECLPEGTFGKEYWKFLHSRRFSPDARLGVQFVDDPELMYVMLRYRQVHDLLHTILGMETNMLGEVAVKWVEAFQTGLPLCVLGAAFGPLRLGPVHTQRYLQTYLPWAIRCGRNARFLMAVYWEKHWEDDITELRKKLNIEPPPVITHPKS